MTTTLQAFLIVSAGLFSIGLLAALSLGPWRFSVSKGMSRWVMHYLCLIPAVPFAASLIILSLPNARRGSAAALAVTGQVAALALSVLAFLPTLQTNGFRAVQNFTWFAFGDNALRIGFVLDPLAAAMAL